MKWQPTPVLLPGKSHERRSLLGYNPWGHKESDTTERLYFNTSSSCSAIRKKEKKENEVAQSCLTLCDPIDCSLRGSSVHGIFQARVLEWGAIAFSDNEILLSHKKEQNCPFCSDMNEYRDSHIE